MAFSAPLKLDVPYEPPYDLVQTLSLIAHARRDPCVRVDGPRDVRLAVHGPTGPLAVKLLQASSAVHAQIEGSDVDWVAPLLPDWLGLNFQPPTFDGPPRLRNLARKHSGLRLPRVPLIFPRLVQIGLPQLVRYEDT